LPCAAEKIKEVFMESTLPKCLICERTTNQAPLLRLRFRDSDVWICAQHLPILIHKPHELADKLPGLDLAGQPDAPSHDHKPSLTRRRRRYLISR
jgi:hypothetical protein